MRSGFCSDCNVPVVHDGRRGPVPKRCKDCTRKHINQLVYKSRGQKVNA